MDSTRNRTLLIVALTLLALYAVAPTLVYFSLPKDVRNDPAELDKRLPDWMPKKHIKLGLDIQGGVQLVLGVDTTVAVDNRLSRVGTELSRVANETKPQVDNAYVMKGEQTLRVVYTPDADIDAVKTQINELFPGLKQVKREGNQVDYQYDDSQMASIRDAALSQAERVVRSRIDKWGVAEPSISRRADKSILVQLPGFQDPEKARELLGRTAQLKFKLLDEQFKGFEELTAKLPPGVTFERRGNHGAVSFISEDKQAIVDMTKGLIPEGRELLFEEEQIAGGKKTRYVSHLLMASTEISGEDVLDAMVTYDSSSFDNRPVVSLKFTGAGGKQFADITGGNVGNRMAIVLDDVVVSDPVINSRISGGSAQITLGGGQGYNETLEEANQLALVLKSGALPAPITIMEERQVGATLGPELANQGIMSVGIGLLLVFCYVFAYYRRPGLIACSVLILNGLGLLALMALFGFSLTLPGFAGFILTLGMAVDGNVLINERIREELKAGKSPRKAVQGGFDRVLWTIVDSNATTLIAAFVLLETNSSGPIRGFAVALIVGLLISLFTALFCSRTMFMWVLGRKKSDQELRRWLGGDAADKARVFKLDFLKMGKMFNIGALVLALAVLGAGFTKGFNWSVDFAGGTEMELIFTKDIDANTIRGAFEQSGLEEVTLQKIGSEGNHYMARFEGQKDGQSAEGAQRHKDLQVNILQDLKEYGVDIQRVDFVGPAIGQELRKQGSMSLVWAILGIIAYIALRFDMRFGPGTLVKICHDVIVLLAFYIFFGRSFDLTSIAALLTVIGYSVNDTVVIYDRIRENLTLNPRREFYDNVNISLNETLARSINTSVSTLISLIGILCFPTSQIWNFGAAMALGVIAATLSSTFVSPLFLIWFEKWKRGQRLKGAPVTSQA